MGVMHAHHIADAGRAIAVLERELADLHAYPKFAGDQDAQRMWLGRTDAERVLYLQDQVSLGRRCVRNMHALTASMPCGSDG
jgi:hypothetical protein